MSEENMDDDKKVLGLSRPGRLELRKTVESGQVTQNFSHRRQKTVTVEVKKKRTFRPGKSGPETAPSAEPARSDAPAEAGGKQQQRQVTLTDAERQTRARALQGARKADAEARLQAELDADRRAREEEEARLQAEEEARQKAEEEARAAEEAEARRRAEDERKRAEEEARRKSEEMAARRTTPAAEEEARPARPKPAAETTEERPAAAPARPARRPGRVDTKKATVGRRGGDDRRRGGKMTVVQALSDDERQRSLASVRRARERERRAANEAAGGDSRKVVREVIIPEAITVQELASRMAVRGAELIKFLMRMGTMATINQTIDADTAELIVSEFGHRSKRVSASDVEVGLGGEADQEEALIPRAPIVTVMGHVDHGKTSLLDALRETDVAAKEAGGITQHIGAYQVQLSSGAQITFLDTPGHAAFTSMRARGGKTADVVVLVVAADDGIMPQTVEAIQHAQAAETPIIVAINKMDVPGANPDRVRQGLLQHNLVVEELGGDILTVEVSAKERINLDKLEEAILLQAELLDLRANPDRAAQGVVVEAKRERGRGVVTTVLVQRGTLRVGDILVAGAQWGRVRALMDYRGQRVEEAGPSVPVEVLGLDDTPVAGDEAVVVENESRAREVTSFRQSRARDAMVTATARGSVEQMLSKIGEESVQEFPIVIKADVHGSLEAILSSIGQMASDEVSVRILLSGVGGIAESDISLAAASKALVIGFNVRADANARALARRDGVEIRYYSVIYDLLEDIRDALSGMLKPTIRETFIGYAKIKQVFNITKVGKVAGCEVTEGVVRRGAKVRLLRDNVVIHEGTLSTLKRHKDEVREVKEGYECGMAFENYQDIREGDMIEAFEVEEVKRTIEG
ncbi:MAG: translation initiation factor IF-2 [Rhodospirillaceae bacterium]|nr:translation initiation factor IF-2 [Rhodospirillaceae bacterium]